MDVSKLRHRRGTGRSCVYRKMIFRSNFQDVGDVERGGNNSRQIIRFCLRHECGRARIDERNGTARHFLAYRNVYPAANESDSSGSLSPFLSRHRITSMCRIKRELVTQRADIIHGISRAKLDNCPSQPGCYVYPQT